MPLRDMIRQRRLNFLKYILDQKEESILSQVFEKQCEKKTKKDWVTSVLADLDLLDLNVTFADI